MKKNERVLSVGKRYIGKGEAVFIIAEMSGNHGHDINQAKTIIDAAADAGADAVKLQTYTPDTITIDSSRPEFVVKTGRDWKGKTLYQLYGEAHTPWEWHKELFSYAKKRGLIAFSTPFDPTAVEFLEKLHVPLYKVASFEIVDIPLLRIIGKTRKPVIMSKGMATEAEIHLALRTLTQYGCPHVVLLQCVSSYPARPEDMNLSTIPDMAKKFKVMAGLSDHSLSNDAAIASVALGAYVIEKHLTLSRAAGGPDASFSLEPAEFKELVRSVRTVEAAIGEPRYLPQKNEIPNIVFRKSLFVVQDIAKGERLTTETVRSIRPGYGLPPKELDRVLGKRARRALKRGMPLKRTDIS